MTVALCGDLSALRDRGPKFNIGSRPLTFSSQQMNQRDKANLVVVK